MYASQEIAKLSLSSDILLILDMLDLQLNCKYIVNMLLNLVSIHYTAQDCLIKFARVPLMVILCALKSPQGLFLYRQEILRAKKCFSKTYLFEYLWKTSISVNPKPKYSTKVGNGREFILGSNNNTVCFWIFPKTFEQLKVQPISTNYNYYIVIQGVSKKMQHCDF